MKSYRNNEGICMRFEVLLLRNLESVRARNYFRETFRSTERRVVTKGELSNIIFDCCKGCLTMAAIPHGAFAARKVRENNERRFLISKMEQKGGNDRESKQDSGYSKRKNTEEGRELTPLKYNSKLMNSIWGLYNRYSVHNFKKNTDADDTIVGTRRNKSQNNNRLPSIVPAPSCEFDRSL